MTTIRAPITTNNDLPDMMNFKAKMFYSTTVSRDDSTFTPISSYVLSSAIARVKAIPLIDSHNYETITTAIGYVDELEVLEDEKYEEPYISGLIHINPDHVSSTYDVSLNNMQAKNMGLSIGIRDIQLDKARLQDGYRQIVSFLPYELSLTYLPVDTRCVVSPYSQSAAAGEVPIDDLELN